MPKEIRYVVDNWEKEILSIAHEAIECAIASAYMNEGGVNLLEEVSRRLADISTQGRKTVIRVILSRKFADTETERNRILISLNRLPGIETRIYAGKGFQHRKNFIFWTEGEVRAMIGSINATSAGLYKNLEVATVVTHEKYDDEVEKLISEFEKMWKMSEPAKIKEGDIMKKEALFKIGDIVKYTSTGQIGAITKVIEQKRGYAYKVMIDGKSRTIPEHFLDEYVDEEDSIINSFVDGDIGGFEDYRIFQTWFRLSRPIEGNIYSYLSSKTIFNPHQFKPLLRFLSPSSDGRLFIADEVGVGKTIETGIIITEMIARDRLDSRTPILIICPNSLGPKWKKEMKDRFQLDFHIHDGKSLRYSLDEALNEGRMPASYMYSIVSLQLLRRKENVEVLKKIEERLFAPLFGMVVVDEAHHMRNTGTDSNELGKTLTSITEMMLMLSATPLNLKNEDLYNQMHILNPELFPDKETFEAMHSPVSILNRIRREISRNDRESRINIIQELEKLGQTSMGEVMLSHPSVLEFKRRIKEDKPLSTPEIVKYDKLFVDISPLYSSFTRTRKREALEHQVQREAMEVGIKLSEREMMFHDDVIRAIGDHYVSEGGDPSAVEFVTNTHRRMVSSCIPAMRDYLQWSLKENEIEYVDNRFYENEDDSNSSTGKLSSELRKEFERLLEESREIEGVDTKYDTFLNVVKKILENPETPQVIVFSFFVRTLEYLKRRLEKDGFKVGIIHGKIPVIGNGIEPDRYSIMEDFKKGKFDILLSSEVGGEGLDFQYCHAILNYDLPYNPMRIEQRIGRIDRFGQKADKIIIANLFIKNTVDEQIYDRLYKRIRLVEDGVGSLEPILGNEIGDLQNLIITGKLTKEQIEEKTRRLQQSIESAKQQMEEFEKHKAELLGDDYLSRPINKLTESSLIHPSDAMNLTKEYLLKNEGCSFEKTGDVIAKISLSEDVVTKLKNFLRVPGNEAGYGALRALMKSDKHINVVFDGSLADSFHDHVFLPPTGYWIKFVIETLKKENEIHNVFKLGTKNRDIGMKPGKYIISLFELKIEGIRKEIEFLGLPLSIEGDVVDVEAIYDLPRILSSKPFFDIHEVDESIDINDIVEKAMQYMGEVAHTRQEEIEAENRFKVESKIAAIRRASELKIESHEKRLNSYLEGLKESGKEENETIINLMKRRIQSEEAKRDHKIEELQKQKEVSVDYSLEGIVYLEVVE